MGVHLSCLVDTAKSTQARLRLDFSLHASCWRTKLAIRFAACRPGGKDSWVPVLRLDLLLLLLRLPQRGGASQPGGIIHFPVARRRSPRGDRRRSLQIQRRISTDTRPGGRCKAKQRPTRWGTGVPQTRGRGNWGKTYIWVVVPVCAASVLGATVTSVAARFCRKTR
jgi:hypothetical protein